MQSISSRDDELAEYVGLLRALASESHESESSVRNEAFVPYTAGGDEETARRVALAKTVWKIPSLSQDRKILTMCRRVRENLRAGQVRSREPGLGVFFFCCFFFCQNLSHRVLRLR